MRNRLIAVAALLVLVSCGGGGGGTEEIAGGALPPAIEQSSYGEVSGMSPSIYTLRNRNGLVAKITNYGAILVELWVPDRNGELADVVLGLDALEDYVGVT